MIVSPSISAITSKGCYRHSSEAQKNEPFWPIASGVGCSALKSPDRDCTAGYPRLETTLKRLAFMRNKETLRHGGIDTGMHVEALVQ